MSSVTRINSGNVSTKGENLTHTASRRSSSISQVREGMRREGEGARGNMGRGRDPTPSLALLSGEGRRDCGRGSYAQVSNQCWTRLFEAD